MTIPSDAILFDRSQPGQTMPVIALHCSGADARQWRHLAAVLEQPFFLIAPNFYGSVDNTGWNGHHPFTLSDEASPILEMIDAMDRHVHLVGHSYGGAVALHIALQRPQAIASLTVYEPTAFHLLKTCDAADADCFAEIEKVAQACANGLVAGAYRAAAERFVDYWSGAGAWTALRSDQQSAMLHWLPKAPLDFRASIEEPAGFGDYQHLNVPTQLLCGEHAPAPTAKVVARLSHVLPRCTVNIIAGAGHMGPVSHSNIVNTQILDFIRATPSTPFPKSSADRASTSQHFQPA